MIKAVITSVEILYLRILDTMAFRFNNNIKYSTVHFLGRCESCDWITEDHTNGHDASMQHSNQTGHVVHFEIGLVGRT